MNQTARSLSLSRCRRILAALMGLALFQFALLSSGYAQPTETPDDPPDVTPPSDDPPTDPGAPPADDPGDPPDVPTAQLINVSTRGKVDSGPGEAFVVGFAIRGEGTTTVVARAVGQGGLGSLLPGVTLLQDPQIEVIQTVDANGNAVNVNVGSNDNWADDTTGFTLIDGTSLDPETGSLPIGVSDSSLVLQDLTSGNYTIRITDTGGGNGVVIGEAVLLDPESGGTLDIINVSTRGKADTGPGEVFTVGFAIRGDAPLTVVARGVGEGGLGSLLPGVSLLADPTVVVNQTVGSDGGAGSGQIATNDNHGDDPNETFVFGTSLDPTSGSLPIGINDAAIVLLDLSSGNYTLRISDVGGGSGVVIGEAVLLDSL